MMSLGDIKFLYQEKIDKLNTRINRYCEIISDYDDAIKRAEKEEVPNISAVVQSKLDYEHKIRNMKTTKKYYQEFVDTSDYLMQFINKDKTYLLIRENEDLQSQLIDLQNKYDYFINAMDKDSDNISSLYGKISRLSSHNTYLESMIAYYKRRCEDVDEMAETIVDLKTQVHDLKTLNDTAVSKNKKLIKTVKRLNKDNESLQTIQRLENRVQQLEDYCNHLLSRTFSE